MPDGQPTHNGHWAGLTGNNTELWNNSQLAGGADGWALGIRYLGGVVNFVYDNASGNEVHHFTLSGLIPSPACKTATPLTIALTVGGWEVCLTGIIGSVDSSGSWPAAFDYTTLTNDSSVFASMAYQQANEAGTVVELTSISVNGDSLATTANLDFGTDRPSSPPMRKARRLPEPPTSIVVTLPPIPISISVKDEARLRLIAASALS